MKRRRLATPVRDGDGDGDDAGDLISGLNDDLLVRILNLLPDTRDAVRTHALSRRWRGLWTGVAALRFDSGYNASKVCTEPAAAEQEHELVPPSFKAAQGWIRYAAQNEVKSLTIELDLPLDNNEHPVVAIDDLASSAKLETMHLRLGDAQLELFSASSTVIFASLTDLYLGDIMVAGDLLSRLVSSSCCPRLRKLHLFDLYFSAIVELLVEADALLELSMEMMDGLQSLELMTPSLLFLCVTDCNLERFKVSAPRLEDVTLWVERHLHIDDVHGHLSTVATLQIELSSHGDIYNNDKNNDASFDILKRCRFTRSLEVSLGIVEAKRRTGDIIKGRIPPLPDVTSLTLRVGLREPHLFGSSIGSILAQCSSIRYYLRLQLCYGILKVLLGKDLLEQDLLCEKSCRWKSHEFSLAHLQEIELKNLIGTDCELQLIQSILKTETRVQKVAISFDPRYCIKDNKDVFNLLPRLEAGSWTTCNDANLSYKWRRHCV